MPQFSKRVSQWSAELNPITEEIRKLKNSGKQIIDLTESNPTKCGFDYLKTDILEPLINIKNLSYEPDPHGLIEAREAVCGYYAKKGIRVEPRQVFITASTSEAYSFLLRLLLDPGDKLLIPRPSYPLFDYLAGLNDAQPLSYRLSYENSWGIDFEDLKREFKNNPKALIVLNPNNPTGNFISQNERERINILCSASSAPIISDEVFLDFSFNAAPRSFADNQNALTFTLSGVSKVLGLPQMKISWIVVSGPEKIQNEAIERLEIIADTYLSANTASQNALKMWLGPHQELIHKEMVARFKTNRDYLDSKVSSLKGLESVGCEGGWHSILRFKSKLNDEEMTLKLLSEQGVLVHPGYFFDFEGEGCLVLSHLIQKEAFQEGVERLVGAFRV